MTGRCKEATHGLIPASEGLRQGGDAEHSRHLYDILDETDDLVSLGVNPHRLKADIIEQLLALVTDGTPQDEWKSKVLGSLSLRSLAAQVPWERSPRRALFFRLLPKMREPAL